MGNPALRVHVTIPTEVLMNGKLINIKPDIYNVNNIKFCNDNDFKKCWTCKEYFDEINNITKYHPQFDINKQREYCTTCFAKKFPDQ